MARFLIKYGVDIVLGGILGWKIADAVFLIEAKVTS